MPRLPRYPCPRCGRQIAATCTGLSVTRRDGAWIHYVYLRTHNNPEGRPCPGATATVEPPPMPACPTERTTP